MTMTTRQALHARLFRRVVRLVRSLRPHHWPVVGGVLARVAERWMRWAQPEVVSVEGFEIRLDPFDDMGLARGKVHDPLVRMAMQEHIPPGGTVIDGGAHIGYYTLFAARLVGSSGHVIAFEPSPDTYALLTHNVQRNGYHNVTLVNGALSDAPGEGKFHLADTSWGDHRIARAEDSESIPVNLHSLDSFLADDQSVDFLKLDVEGAELPVLEGGRAVFERNPQLVLVIEFAPLLLPDSIAPEEILDQLFSRFTVIFNLDEKSKSMEAAEKAQLLATYTRDNERFTNLLCMNR